MPSPAPTRHAVGVSTLNTAIVSAVDQTLAAGTTLYFPIDVDAATSGLYLGFDAVTPPQPINEFSFTMGQLVNVFLFTDSLGVEIQIDEGIDGSGTASTWRRALTVLVTPSVFAKIDGYRVNQSFTRIGIANTSAFLAFVDVGIKCVTL